MISATDTCALIFNIDGVLVDRETLSCRATPETLAIHGVRMTEPESYGSDIFP